MLLYCAYKMKIDQIKNIYKIPEWQLKEISLLSNETLSILAQNNDAIGLCASLILNHNKKEIHRASPDFKTKLGQLYNDDCLKIIPTLKDESIDCVFADPPFNLSKNYGPGISDKYTDLEYLTWTKDWIEAIIPKLKTGGSFFLFNLPSWNINSAMVLQKHLTFKHWITVDLKLNLPIKGRLYPSHYSLLYFIKGNKANTFTPPRLPISTCSKCGWEQNDYGGYKHKLNPSGMSLTDVWDDIPPVRHKKFKKRSANELSIKLLDRVLDISTNEGDVVLDPFAGSGSTLAVAEMKKRKWIGIELGDINPIKDRFKDINTEKELLKKYQSDINILFTDKSLQLRKKSGMSYHKYNISKEQLQRVFGLDLP